MTTNLVEAVVDLASVDTLGQQGLHGIPGDLLWGQVGATLGITWQAFTY